MDTSEVKASQTGRAPHASLALIMSVLCTACTDRSSDTKISNGDLAVAKADIQRALDKKRQCAPLLTGSEPIQLPPEAEKHGGTKALLDAGLIEQTPGSGEIRTYRTTPQAARYVVKWQGVATNIDLCYGRRKVTLVDSLPPQELDTSPTVRYRYRIVDAPDWAHRPEMQAAFPFLGAALTREFVSRDRVRFRNGHAQTAALTDELDMMRPIEFFSP